MPSIQAKMISGLFKLIGINRMLDKQGADFEKLLESHFFAKRLAAANKR